MKSGVSKIEGRYRFDCTKVSLAGVIAVVLQACVSQNFVPVNDSSKLHSQASLGTRTLAFITQDNLRFKDLNSDGELNPYEDWRLTPEQRSQDLLQRMTLEEKAGTMLHGSMSVFGSTSYDLDRANRLIIENDIGSVITRLPSDSGLLARENNTIQALAETRRLGIPLTISTDPRNHFNYLMGASISAGGFSQWPEALGFAAIGDPGLVREFGNIASQEYRAVGIAQALSPMADLATEPRWPRVVGTFGEDAEQAKRLVGAYIEGFQNGRTGLSAESVATVVKHWVAYGAGKDGHDSHSYFGRFSAFPGDNFAYHIIPFENAFDAQVSGVMPSYSILENLSYQGENIEQVGAGYSRFLLTDLLRNQYGFDGVILSDWAITLDCDEICIKGEVNGKIQELDNMSTAWGVIDLTPQQRYAKALDAGIDQFGGIEDPVFLIDAFRLGLVTESRIDESARRILQQKFELGLFENAFADEEQAIAVVGNSEFKSKAEIAQSRALVLLENKAELLPLNSSNQKLFLYGIDRSVAQSYGFTIVENAADADLAILRLSTPYEQPHSNYVFGRRHHEGNLAFLPDNPDYQAVLQVQASGIPSIATVFLNRPAVMTAIQDKVDSLIGNFGVSDKVLLSVILGEAKPEGRLPIELPSSMAAVEAQYEDVPYDSESPLYPYGYGLSYEED
ncbi:UNVERIFIED_CONTAM: hypothetical protein GTU68_064926 [Idotea baltica]|nr:hypothetical protein [Idotea baltica]